VVGKGWFGYKAFMDKFLSGSAEDSVVDIGFPEVEDFGYDVIFEKAYIGNNIKHGRFMHPV
jgi:hypothetical protein